MSVQHLTQSNSDRARQICKEYQAKHDLSSMRGLTAGIDPVSGRIWFGDSIEEVVAKRKADGSEAALVFARIGYDTYYRKGGRR